MLIIISSCRMNASFPTVNWAGSGSKFNVFSECSTEFVHEVWTNNRTTSQLPNINILLIICINTFLIL